MATVVKSCNWPSRTCGLVVIRDDPRRRADYSPKAKKTMIREPFGT